MKIGLINPCRTVKKNAIHLGLAYIASWLRTKLANVEIAILDTGVSTEDEVQNFLRKDFDVLGITATSHLYKEACQIAEKAKSINQGRIIVLGGPHTSVAVENALQNPSYDFAVYNEGECTFEELIRSIETGISSKPAHLKAIDGLVFRDGNRIVVNRPRTRITNLDEIPYPALDLFDPSLYDYIPLLSARGCPYQCCFCASATIWGKKHRQRSIENIVDEIEQIQEGYGARLFGFVDDTFNTSLNRVNEFCDSLLRRKIRILWDCYGFRLDCIDLETAKKMRKAGCSGVSVGIESISPFVLKKIKKGMTIEDIERGIAILHRAGIQVAAQFMIGNPGDTLDTVQRSIDFAKQSTLTRAVFHPAIPYPSTELWHHATEEGSIVVDCDYTGFRDVNPPVIFETDVFPKQDRIRAIELARKVGYLIRADDAINAFGRTIKKWILFIFGSSLGWYLYAFLRRWYFRFTKWKAVLAFRIQK